MKRFWVFYGIILLLFVLNLFSCASPPSSSQKMGAEEIENKVKFWIQMMGTVEGTELMEYQHLLVQHKEHSYPYLIKALKQLSPRIRGSAAYALGQIGNREAIEHLLPLLDDPEDSVRFEAAASLVDLKENIGLYYMILALDHKSLYFRQQANDVLKNSTGQDFAFEPNGHPYDRRDARNEWIRWWNKNKNGYRIPKSPPKASRKLENIPLD